MHACTRAGRAGTQKGDGGTSEGPLVVASACPCEHPGCRWQGQVRTDKRGEVVRTCEDVRVRDEGRRLGSAGGRAEGARWRQWGKMGAGQRRSTPGCGTGGDDGATAKATARMMGLISGRNDLAILRTQHNHVMYAMRKFKKSYYPFLLSEH